MRALVLNSPGHLTLQDWPEATFPSEGEVLVQVHRVGICGTDIHAYGGKQPFFSYPRVLGHELGVEVLALGPNVSNVRVGDKCAVEPYLNCQTCIACRRGKGNCCANLRVLGVHAEGGMRERFTLPARKLHVRNSLSFDQLALVETLGIGAHAVARAQVETDEWILVIGAGPIGLGVMQFAREAGAHVIALDTNEQRLRFCRDHWGIEHAILADENALNRVRDLTNGDLPTAVFDATGHPTSMNRAFDFVAPSGRLTFVGLHQGEVVFRDADFHRKELSLLATRNALPQDFERILSSIERGTINTTPWITHRAQIEEVPTTFSTWTNPQSGVLKALIEI